MNSSLKICKFLEGNNPSTQRNQSLCSAFFFLNRNLHIKEFFHSTVASFFKKNLFNRKHSLTLNCIFPCREISHSKVNVSFENMHCPLEKQLLQLKKYLIPFVSLNTFLFKGRSPPVEWEGYLMCKYLFKNKSALQRDRFLWVEGLFPSRSLYLFQWMVQFTVELFPWRKWHYVYKGGNHSRA